MTQGLVQWTRICPIGSEAPQRCDGKTIDGIPVAMDADTGEETAIRILFSAPPKYYTISKRSLCALLKMSGERRAECGRLRNKTITGSAISLLEESGFRGPVRRSPGYSLFLWYVVLLNKGGHTYERLHEGPAPAVFLGTGASQPLYSPKVNGKRMAPTSPSIQRRRARRSWPG